MQFSTALCIIKFLSLFTAGVLAQGNIVDREVDYHHKHSGAITAIGACQMMCPIVLSDLENRGIRSEDGPAVLSLIESIPPVKDACGLYHTVNDARKGVNGYLIARQVETLKYQSLEVDAIAIRARD
ncbi:hypothetical protein B0H16DRAFT_1454252 [Mycena metata]|uniref:Uncharacterized protein n=1 Tax=Mycena metata TaxID=1033252 RepID=A0AAD7JL87_9AGAR|nr:hypothetical protein B0H16DRAFT_1454252 [Mycena metata]